MLSWEKGFVDFLDITGMSFWFLRDDRVCGPVVMTSLDVDISCDCHSSVGNALIKACFFAPGEEVIDFMELEDEVRWEEGTGVIWRVNFLLILEEEEGVEDGKEEEGEEERVVEGVEVGGKWGEEETRLGVCCWVSIRYTNGKSVTDAVYVVLLMWRIPLGNVPCCILFLKEDGSGQEECNIPQGATKAVVWCHGTCSHLTISMVSSGPHIYLATYTHFLFSFEWLASWPRSLLAARLTAFA